MIRTGMLDVAHHRLPILWLLAVVGLSAPWLLTRMDWTALVLTRAKTSSCIVASVHDGDTLRAICDGERLQVRLHCIDAPEIAQTPWGQESRDHLRAIIPRQIQVEIQDTDRYGRTVARILTPEGIDLNQRMVRDGQAAVYRRYCSDPDYARAETEARARGLGIWSAPGDHQTPWEHRDRSG